MVEQFKAADEKISNFLDQLDSPNTSIKVRKPIICKDYPSVYHNEYVPSLLKLSPDNTKNQLDNDLKLALYFYKDKDKDNIGCD